MDSDEARLALIRKAQQKVAEVSHERDIARQQLADALVIIKALLLALPDEIADQAILEMPESISEMLEF